jgi:nucleotide-binding universal stress UspA family protein
MNQPGTGPVVVGVDFSTPSDAAVAYAAWEAEAQHRGLTLLHGYDSLALGVPPITGYEVSMTHDAEDRLAAIAARVRAQRPGVEVTTRVWRGSGARALVDVSTEAALVVVASRGHGGFRQLLVGSVAAQVVGHAFCPVVVVRPGKDDEATGSEPAPGPVLVGVDGSGYSHEAIDFAFAEAARRGTSLVAVTVWTSPDASGLSESRVWGEDAGDWQRQMEEDADRTLSEALSGAGDRYPEVEVVRETVHGLSTSHELMEAGDRVGAALTVVGSRGHGGFAGLMLGSVSQELVSHGLSTLAVVRGEKDPID